MSKRIDSPTQQGAEVAGDAGIAAVVGDVEHRIVPTDRAHRNVVQEPWGFTINHWNVMETSCGTIGGYIYTFGMVDRAYPEPQEKQGLSWASLAGIVHALGLSAA